ncbi:MAG: zf-HC2 domain-containing protein [Candidatus Aminicenantales bacterium]
MKKCKYEDFIDDYLLNRLSLSDREKFEEHYFNCSHCFQEMRERNELIATIKHKGYSLFQDEFMAEETKGIPWFETVRSYLTPRQWALAAVSAALVLVVIFGVIPNLRTTTSPHFFINEDMVRGESITLISPVIDVPNVPSHFRWRSHGENVEYKIYLYNEKLLWTETTTNNFISLPEEVKKLMKPGETYSWQIKAFAQEGGLIAVSSRVRFKITPSE